MSNDNAVVIDSVTGEVEGVSPPDNTRYRCPLQTAGDCKRELAKLYRESRSGKLDANVLSKYTFVLNVLNNMIQTSELEARLEALEEQGANNG